MKLVLDNGIKSMSNKKKLSVVILKGLPASGKSTWAKQKVKEGQGKWKRINKDDLRSMIDAGQYSSKNEDLVLRIRDDLLMRFLHEGCNVIVDDTNINPKHEEGIRKKIENVYGQDVNIEVKEFDTDLETCIERDKNRENSVGEDVIRRMARQWKGIFHHDYTPNPVYTISKPFAVICDLDGTLALIGNRSPYDASNCDKVDEINVAVEEVLVALYKQGYEIILLSGREEKYREVTERFLKKYDVPYTILLMRQNNDNRKDSIIKKEIYEKYIQSNYNVFLVLDDRDQVVEMWRRDLKIPCFQVNYGNF